MTRRITNEMTTHALDLPAIHETVVDGVQTFWVDAGPPFVATLHRLVTAIDERVSPDIVVPISRGG